jgi:twitching motility protein PilT
VPFNVENALRHVIHSDGSDLHLKVGAQPMTRINGSLVPIADTPPMQPEDTEEALGTLISHLPALVQEFEEEGEADFSYSIPHVSRFRVSAFRQRGSISIVARAIPYQVRTIEDLGLPPVIRTLAEERRGIILLTGTTGSGKSTTLAAMIDHINETRPDHIITLEDPIEYLHSDKRSIINQREVGSDTKGFAQAMRRVLRQDPDVILIGEMRDEETVRTALSAAETGHLVLSTLHTLDATETINRIIDFFPPHLQQQARVMLASTLRGAVSQRLVPTADGLGRVAASEVMVVTGRVEDLILNPEETGKISQVISEGEYYGMQTFDQSLLAQVEAGRVSEAVAMEFASSPHDFKLMLSAAGRRASDISQVEPAPPPAPAAAGPAPLPEAAEPVEAPSPTVPVATGAQPQPAEPGAPHFTS